LNQTLPNGDITNTALITSTGGSYASIQQWIEDYTTPTGKYVTFSFWAKTNKSGAYASIYNVSSQWTTSTLIPDGQWHYYQHTSYLPPGGGALRPEVWTNTGAVSGDYLEVAQLQLEVGETATPFEKRFYSEELALCQRYFQFIRTAGIQVMRGATATTYSNAGLQGSYHFFAPMRSNPALSNAAGGATITASGRDTSYNQVTNYELQPVVRGEHGFAFNYQGSSNGGVPLPTSVAFLIVSDDIHADAEL
jgi:hypothetical protein